MRWVVGEKVCTKHAIQGRSTKRHNRFLKRLSARVFRRMAKHDPEDAPQIRRYHGYSD